MHTFYTPKSAVMLNYDCMPILGLKSRDSTAFVSSSVRIIYKLKNFPNLTNFSTQLNSNFGLVNLSFKL